MADEKRRSSMFSTASMKGSVPPGTLPQEIIDGLRLAFQHLDHNRTGKIDIWELKTILEAMGMRPTEEDMFQLMSEVDVTMSGQIDFSELLTLVGTQKNEPMSKMMALIWQQRMLHVVVMRTEVDVWMRMY